VFVRGWSLSQVWVFIVFPIVGGIIGGVVYRLLFERQQAEAGLAAEQA
jgi:aquaporin Z